VSAGYTPFHSILIGYKFFQNYFDYVQQYWPFLINHHPILTIDELLPERLRIKVSWPPKYKSFSFATIYVRTNKIVALQIVATLAKITGRTNKVVAGLIVLQIVSIGLVFSPINILIFFD
jgi:hypothetical protein